MLIIVRNFSDEYSHLHIAYLKVAPACLLAGCLPRIMSSRWHRPPLKWAKGTFAESVHECCVEARVWYRDACVWGHSAKSQVQQPVEVALRTRSFTFSIAVTAIKSSSIAGAEVGVSSGCSRVIDDWVGARVMNKYRYWIWKVSIFPSYQWCQYRYF